MRGVLVRAFPLALFAALSEWVAIDLVRTAPPIAWALGGIALSVAAVAAIHGSRRSRAAWHRAARAVLAVTFIGERLAFAGVDVVPMIGFLVLLMTLASLQSLERTFGPVVDSVTEPALVAKVDAAAIAAYVRALALMGFTFVASLLLIQVVPFIAVQGRSLALVLGLAIALLSVVAWLSLAPARLRRKGPKRGTRGGNTGRTSLPSESDVHT
jgi:hypothetical protein